MLKASPILKQMRKRGWFPPMEVTRVLQVAPSTLYKACYAGKVVHRRVGRTIFVHRDSVLEYYADPEIQDLLKEKLFDVAESADET